MITDDQSEKTGLGLDSSYEAIAEAVRIRLAKNQRVRRNLPGHGRLRIDRQVPFLCIYRDPPDREDAGTVGLVTTEAAYLFGDGSDEHYDGISLLCREVNEAMQEHFGTFLLLEIWSQPVSRGGLAFEIVTSGDEAIPSTIETLQTALNEIQVNWVSPTVTTRVAEADLLAPPGLRSLMPLCADSGEGGCCVLGLAVTPFYRAATSGTLYPMVLERLRRQLAVAIRKTVAQFTGTAGERVTKTSTTHSAKAISFHSLGPSSFVKAARIVDQQLCEVSETFDFLLQVTPTNADDARQEFFDNGFKDMPRLTYRPLPYRPSLLKRQLFNIQIERIEDPTLAYLFWEKQEEIDRKLSALRDLDTPNFLLSSLQLYGEADQPLVDLSREILRRIPETIADSGSESPSRVGSTELIERARHEFDYYHTRMSEFNATVETCDEIASGIMVSHERLLVSKQLCLSAERVEPLLHHEIGTHLLTYFNGRCQPFRQLYAGLSGYEELQEGLAVLAEYLVGGLTANRARTLAGRVVAVNALMEGDSFADTFSLLHEEFGLSEHRAFTTTLRAFRGGGLTKDIIYLRGLRDLLNYLSAGHDIEPLYVGKIALRHVPFVQEMRRRKIILPPRILPRFWDNDHVRERLEACRETSVLELLESNL